LVFSAVESEWQQPYECMQTGLQSQS